MIGAIVGAVATIASTAVNIGMSVKASKEAEKLNKKTSPGEQSALALQRMKTADIAGQGGMTAGQYSRALMQDDAYAMQVQGLTNKIESQSVFGDSFRKEAFYRLALSDIKGFTQKTASNLQDMDANMIVQNAQLSLQASSNLRQAEGEMVNRENEIKAQELQMKQAIMSNVAKGIASTAALVGAGMKYYDAQKKDATVATPVANPVTNSPATLSDTKLSQPTSLVNYSEPLQGSLTQPSFGNQVWFNTEMDTQLQMNNMQQSLDFSDSYYDEQRINQIPSPYDL